MAWTSPRTWVDGEVPTAALMTAHLGANQLVLKTSLTNDGKIAALSSSYLADLSGTNLTGLVKLASANTRTVGKQTFSDPVRIVVPVGTDLYDGTSGNKTPGSVWIEGDYFHHVDDAQNEWRFLGTSLGAAGGGAVNGSVWVESTYLHYIDASGVDRYLYSNSAQHSDAAAIGGSLWAETYAHWIQQTGTQEYRGHADITHTDSNPHTDSTSHNDHNDHSNYTDHSDAGSGHTDISGHNDFNDYTDHTDYVHVDQFNGHSDSYPYTDYTDHTDHDDHSDAGGHSNHSDHSDHTNHSDVAADSRPEFIGPL